MSTAIGLLYCSDFWNKKKVLCFSCLLVFVPIMLFCLPISTNIFMLKQDFDFKLCLNPEATSGNLTSRRTDDDRKVWIQDTLNESTFAAYNKLDNEVQQILTGQDKSYIMNIAENYKVPQVRCKDLFDGNEQSLRAAQTLNGTHRGAMQDETYLKITENCKVFHRFRHYIMSPLTTQEMNFRLAFSIIAYNESEMVERLLRAIYRPQNYYCIHVDLKADDSFYRAMSAVAQCFPNVFLTTTRVGVLWGTFTVLEAELICMKELWRYGKWRYFINLTGQEFPLKTNFELVKMLQAFNGSNNIGGTILHANEDRWKSTCPPYGLRPVKGSVHIAASRNFVDYILHSDVAQALRSWAQHVEIPDETFFATLNYNPQLGIKGTFRGHPDENRWLGTRYKVWENKESVCAGRYVREICILSTGDLPRLGKAVEMFANKFHIAEDRLVLGCLEEKLLNDTRDHYLGHKQFNTSLYSSMDFVRFQVT